LVITKARRKRAHTHIRRHIRNTSVTDKLRENGKIIRQKRGSGKDPKLSTEIVSIKYIHLYYTLLSGQLKYRKFVRDIKRITMYLGCSANLAWRE